MRQVSGCWWAPWRPSHYIDPMLNPVLGIVGTPVIQASDQHLIAGGVVQLYQPSGDAAMLCFEHGEQGSDDTSAVDHGSGRLN